MMWVSFLGLTLLPILSSTGLVPAERSDGSLDSLLSLPVKPSRILAAKTVMGLILCIGPMATATLVSLLVAGGRELPGYEMVAFYAGSTVTTLSLFIWMLALTIRLPNEARAGLLAMGVLILWLLATAALAIPSVPSLAMSISPFALVYGVTDQFARTPPVIAALAAQALIAMALWFWAAKKISGLEDRP